MKVKYNQELFDWLYSLDYDYVMYHKYENYWSFDFKKEDYKHRCETGEDDAFIRIYSNCDGEVDISIIFNNGHSDEDEYTIDMLPTKENITALFIAHGLYYNFY